MVENLEDFLDKQIYSKNYELDNKIFEFWEYFGYYDLYTFQTDLNLLLETIYKQIKIISKSKSRPNQQEFRNNLMNYYNNRCAITGNDSIDELEACHIVDIKDNGDYNINNGLILEANLHKTYDKYQWIINPDTLKIEVNSLKIPHSVKNHIGAKVNLSINPFLYNNLKIRYNKFIELSKK
jgi:hypothetical protein